MKSAVVFAYHNIGVRCIKALLNFGIKVPLVVTHKDNANENIWFDSVAQLAEDYHIPFITPDNPNSPEVIQQITLLKPDFIFSFYYRNLLKSELLEIPKHGAFNIHGSLLPYYRGRVPINWAIINGETQTGATLHKMNSKPDNGDIVSQLSVPILIDDTALDVFNKVTTASELVLLKSLADLCNGSAKLTPQNLSLGAYFYGRKPEDGKIPATANARQIHNFVRALTHPYPGAFTNANGKLIHLWKTRILNEKEQEQSKANHEIIFCENRLLLNAASGGCLEILEISVDNKTVSNQELARLFNKNLIVLN